MNHALEATTVHRPRSSRWLSALLVFALTFGAAAALFTGLQRGGWLGSSHAAGPGAAVPPVVSLPAWRAADDGAADWTAVAPAPVVMPAPAGALPWTTTLWMGRQAYPLRAGSLALPSGATFQVELARLPAGEVRVFALNPQGHGALTPLWTARVAGGGTVRSPTLRLVGTRGLETLHVEHRDTRGRLRTERVQVWHL